MKTRIVRKFDRRGVKFEAQVKIGFFWEVLDDYRPYGGRDESECVRLAKQRIDRLLESGEKDVIIYPEDQA